ncbi:MAG: sensor histidine kinase [Tepidisphaeraceae bacterium]
MGEQARQLSAALALASKPALATGQTNDLRLIGQDLIKSRNILFVVFLAPDGNPITHASRDPDFSWNDLSHAPHSTQNLMQVRELHSPLFGEFLEVTAPILTTTSPPKDRRGKTSTTTARDADARGAGATRLIGYVAVGMSQIREQSQIRRTNILAASLGSVVVVLSIPLAYLLVHRIFLPIRQLVDATCRIARGDLDACVAVHRRDVIGNLARSFNEMVIKVKQQQTELEDANDKLADANRGLEEKVHQRTAQLETANKRLSSEIAEKEDFLRAVSHDLNAPLRNISGMATMLLMKYREKLEEDMVHRLERIQKNVEVETDLISELLELSRIKTRRQKMESVDLHVLIDELTGMFENDLKSRGISLIVDGMLPVLDCERARLRQVFQNLVDNAIKYMGDGPFKQIHIGCVPGPSEAMFYVQDTGVGIDPEDIDKVFFVFRRGKGQATQNVPGKGVGLASVKSIIETYNGTIWVESKLGQGSTFKFTINGKYVPQTGRAAHHQGAAAVEAEMAAGAV